MLGLYLHIPFCDSICHYCNFNRGLFDSALKLRYVDALAREISAAGNGTAVDTIFFGGGTPSVLEPGEVGRLITVCHAAFAVSEDVEITLETNPETATLAKLTGMRAAGVNRLSFGVQSLDDEELRRLGRRHSAETARQAVRTARNAGFDNVSLDLMCWLPGQTSESWRRTVDGAVALEPEHVSCYLLELYPNAPLKEAMARRVADDGQAADPDWVQVDDDAGADMYLEAFDTFEAAGYRQYEISNAARPGRDSRHNLKYWSMGDWHGFGCGAHSTVDGVRWRNVSATTDYVSRVEAGGDVTCERRAVPPAERAAEAVFTGLRLSAGLDTDEIARAYGWQVWSTHREQIRLWVDEGLAWSDGARVGLTRRGMLVSNELLAALI